ncbi:MAG: patatin-like phospholipase family protein [Trueperaceae bacterium]|nr:patatin-like phospholipase family protein [Trueperaceae bacterium]
MTRRRGAARGAAHVGVLRVLREAGVPIDIVIGTSMGSLIGGLYAAGFDTRTLAAVVAEVDPAGAAELLVPPRGGLLDGAPLSILLDALLEGMQLGETPIPYYPVVVELASSTAQVAPPGPLADAIRASTAIPALLDPVEIDGRFFYDGAIRQSVPSELARELGATYVLAVWFDREIPYDPQNVQANLSRIYIGMLATLNEGGKEGTNRVLDPNLVQNTYMDFALAADFVRAGERVARDALPTILADLADLGIALEAPGDPNVGRPINEGWQERLAAARRAVAVRPRPWNLGFDVGLSPAEWGERLTPSPVPTSSRVRLGVDLRDGPLGAASVGVSYARNVTGGTHALELRAAWRPTYALEPYASLSYDLAGTLDGRLGVRLRLDPGWTVAGAWRLPAGVVEGSAAWRGPGAWVDLDVAHGVGVGWTRAHVEARATLAAPEGTALEPATLRLRLLAGTATAGLPPLERFSVGPAIGLRALTPDAFSAERLVAGSAELAWRLGAPQAIAEAALVTPSVWAFADAARFAGPAGASGAWGAGLGAGLTGTLFGLVPFDVGVDVGYGAPTGSWRLSVRATPTYPVAWRPGPASRP